MNIVAIIEYVTNIIVIRAIIIIISIVLISVNIITQNKIITLFQIYILKSVTFVFNQYGMLPSLWHGGSQRYSISLDRDSNFDNSFSVNRNLLCILFVILTCPIISDIKVKKVINPNLRLLTG